MASLAGSMRSAGVRHRGASPCLSAPALSRGWSVTTSALLSPCQPQLCQRHQASSRWQAGKTRPPLASRRQVVVLATQSGGRPGKKKTKMVDINGDVTKDLGNGMFQVKLDNGVSVIAYVSGKMQQSRIKVLMGDKVTVELSPYDLTKGRITYRFRPGDLAGAAPASAQQ